LTAPRLRLAQAALVWERLWPALWPMTALVLGFLVVAAFDLLPLLPGWLHAAALLGWLGLVGAAGVLAWRELRLPSPAEARRRIETASGLAHRPLQALDDRLASPAADLLALALWRAHRVRMEAAANRLRPIWPHAGLVERDPRGMRALLMLLLLLGVVSAGGDLWPRIGHALRPALAGPLPRAASGWDLWITPPDYTGLPPIYRGTAVAAREAASDRPVPVPAGSTILARVHGGPAAPELLLDGKASRFEALGTGEFSVKAPIGQAARIGVAQDGSTLASIAIAIVPDHPPTAEWTEPARVLARGTLRLDYAARDDYGVKSLTLEMKRPTGTDPPVTIPVTAPPAARETKSALFEDLTASDWAGLPVELTLVARDAIDQEGRSAPQVLKLPEREFHNPVAKAVIEQRKVLRSDPGQADVAAETLGDLALQTGLYHEDPVVFLGLRSASRRLALDPKEASSAEIRQLLWDLAVRIEDGDVPDSEKSLREAQQALQDALDHNASDKEIERLMGQLQQAIQRYLQALSAEAGQTPPAQGNGRQISAQDIGRMLDEARKLAQTGARDAAKQALANLQELLESLRAGQPQSAEGAAQSQALQDLARRQRELLDKSYDAARKGAEGRQGEPKPGESKQGDLAGEQEQLRQQLGEMMRKLGEQGDPPQAFGRAERAMRGAGEALKRGEPGEAVGPEGDALDQLQQGARELAERQGGSRSAGAGNGQTDPFGRNGPATNSNGDVKLPAAMDLQKSREILDELRRRAGEADRPRIERDYLNRLLQRF
jgi:uncharacterized protein (TIGR02302 family)